MFDWKPVYVMIAVVLYCFAIVYAGLSSLYTEDVQTSHSTVQSKAQDTRDGYDRRDQ
jgi:hypothetical protein